MEAAVTIRRALISVFDKTGIETFAKALVDMGYVTRNEEHVHFEEGAEIDGTKYWPGNYFAYTVTEAGAAALAKAA